MQYHHRAKEEKKNNLWLKNIPKHYNTVEALTAFFKKYGHIRDVYPSVDKNVACVVFFKEQDTLNAYNNSENVFGKPLIFKTLNPDEKTPAQLMSEIKEKEIMRKRSEHE